LGFRLLNKVVFLNGFIESMMHVPARQGALGWVYPLSKP